MRGRKESLGSIKEGTRSKGRTVGRTTVKGSVKESGRTTGLMETGHVSGGSVGSRKMTTGKGGSHK
jgi:hypothetical protein